jgi:hypothetical protein
VEKRKPNPGDEVYRFADLSGYSLRQRLLIRLAAFVFYAVIKAIGSTISYSCEGRENLEKAESGGKKPIYAFWHERLFLGTYVFRDRGIVVMNSLSFDGAYMARTVQKFGFGSVRGSSTRGGLGALVEMIRLVRRGFPTGFTVDGPRGPRYEAKPGCVTLAKKTGATILPFMIEAKHYWTINSWDKLQIPRPFTKARTFYGEPILVAADADDQAQEEARKRLQDVLGELLKRGEEWRKS